MSPYRRVEEPSLEGRAEQLAMTYDAMSPMTLDGIREITVNVEKLLKYAGFDRLLCGTYQQKIQLPSYHKCFSITRDTYFQKESGLFLLSTEKYTLVGYENPTFECFFAEDTADLILELEELKANFRARKPSERERQGMDLHERIKRLAKKTLMENLVFAMTRRNPKITNSTLTTQEQYSYQTP